MRLIKGKQYLICSSPVKDKPGEAKWIALGRGEAIGGIDVKLGEPRKPAVLRVEHVFADGTPLPKQAVRLDDLEGHQRVFLREGSVATVYVGESYRAVGWHFEGRKAYKGQSAPITITAPETSVRVVLLEQP